MAQRVKKTYDKSRSKSATAASTEASNDNLLWMVGFVMLIVGLFSVVSVVSEPPRSELSEGSEGTSSGGLTAELPLLFGGMGRSVLSSFGLSLSVPPSGSE